MTSNICIKLRAPVLSALMLFIGSIASLNTYTSEIIKRGDPIKVPYQFFFQAGVLIPLILIWWTRYLRYVHVNSILENNLTKHEYQAILENSNQTFICHDDSHEAKYFNSEGHRMLKEIAEMTEDKDSNIQDLDAKKSVFDVHG